MEGGCFKKVQRAHIRTNRWTHILQLPFLFLRYSYEHWMILLTSLNSEISAKQNSISLYQVVQGRKTVLAVKYQTTECICESCKFEKEHTKLVELYAERAKSSRQCLASLPSCLESRGCSLLESAHWGSFPAPPRQCQLFSSSRHHFHWHFCWETSEGSSLCSRLPEKTLSAAVHKRIGDFHTTKK